MPLQSHPPDASGQSPYHGQPVREPVAGSGLPDGHRDSSEFEKAHRHSRRVRHLRFVLPIAGLVVVFTIILAVVVRHTIGIDIDLTTSGIEDGKLVMSNPKLNGFDAQRRPYSLTARTAVQSIEDPTRVELNAIDARLPMGDDVWANVVAGNGTFDANTKRLELGGKVTVTTSQGMTLKLDDAYIDLEAGAMDSDRPIQFDSDQASITSGALRIRENGDRIIFDTNVKLVIRPEAFER